jgi:hypothetical protein
LLVGDHVASLDEAVLGGAKIRFEGLDEWTNFSAVKIGASDGGVVKGPSRFDLVTQPPITVKSDELGGAITLSGQHSGHFGHRQIDWEYHSSFDVSPNKPASIRSLSQTFFELQHVFALLTWHRSPISYLSVFRPVENDPMNPSGEKWSGLYGHWSAGSLKDKSSTRLLTYLAHVLADLPQIISSWFRSPLAIKASRHLFTSIIRSEGQYLQFKFLALMQTVEALHRSLDSKTYMPPADYEVVVRRTLVASIPGNVGADHRTSLESRIKYGNELSLRTRFKELFLRLPDSLRLHVCNDWRAFVGFAVEMRNALTHPNSDGTTVEPDPTKMWQASQRIKLLLTMVLLNEVGLSYDKIEKIAKDQHWRSLARD